MLTVVAGTAVVSSCAKREPSPAASAQILRVSARNEPADLDPATATLPDEFGILRALSEGLLIPGANGEPEPGVASRYEVSPDGLRYTFHLRPDAKWSNGDAVTAADFIASYRRLLTPTTAAQKPAVFFPVKNAQLFFTGKVTDFATVGFRAADRHTLVVTLEKPTPRFPSYVVSGPWIPVHLPTLERHGRKWTTPENFVGNGPFLLAEWRPHQRITVKKNPRWHGAARVRLDQIQFTRFDSGDAEERAYRAGQIEATMSVPATKVEVYARERPGELHRQPMIETRYLAFNTRRAALRDARVRRALALAIDRQLLVDRVKRGGQPPATRMLPPALTPTLATAKATADLSFNPDEARRLLAEAGASGTSMPKLELTGWTDTPVLEAIQAMWRKELGIDVAIAVREAKVHVAALAAGDYDIAFVTAIPDVADAANLLGDFVTGAPENYPQWSDARFDAALAQAAMIADERTRAERMREVEDRLLTQAPTAPLYFNAKIWLMSPRVHGWQEDGLWTRCYHLVYLDPL